VKDFPYLLVTEQYEEEIINKTVCDFCDEEPQYGVLIEKPNSMIVNGQMIMAHRPKPLHICLDCLTREIENL